MLGTVLWITALAGVGGTGAGGILTCGFRRDAERTISLLLSFAAGVMLAVVCGDLLADALSQRSGAFGLGLTAGGVLSGYGLVGLLNRVAAQDQPEQSQGLFWAGVVMAAAIALHNLPEGMVIGASFARGAENGGLAMAAVIGLHNIPEGMAVGVVYAGYLAGTAQITAAGALALSLGIAIQNFPEGAIISMPLRAEGMPKRRAFWDGVLSGIVEPIGAVLTILAAGIVVPALPYLLSFAAGAMLYVVVEELIPEMSQGQHSNVGTMFFAVGFSVMMVLDVALG